MNPLLRFSAVACCATLLGIFPAGLRAAAGDVDPRFTTGAGGVVYTTTLQPDRKILVGGNFSNVYVGGIAHPYRSLLRVNADGTLDTAFNPLTGGKVYALAVQSDGKILVGGYFYFIQNGVSSLHGLARFNADGTLDAAFNPNPASVTGIVIQPDGRIVIWGQFATIATSNGSQTVAQNWVARLSVDGTLDTTFNPNPNNIVQSLALQTDGKMVLGGYFTALQPNGATTATKRQSVARINVDGTLDTTFNPNPDGGVLSVGLQADGKILLGGTFLSFQPNGTGTAYARGQFARLNADGTVDTPDPQPNGLTYNNTVQTDGKILLAGSFTELKPDGGTSVVRRRVARLNTDGSVDAFSFPFEDFIYSTANQPDGDVIVGGDDGSGWLLNDPAPQRLLVISTGSIQWQRGGASPETLAVRFELSTDGGNTWTDLGTGSRISGGWVPTAASLPNTGLVRARARTTGGYRNGSSGLVELAASYPDPDISVEQPVGTSLTDGTGTVNFGEAALGVSSTTVTKTFVVRNAGQGTLTVSGVTVDGTNASDFVVNTAAMSPSLGQNDSTTLSVAFAPGGTASSTRTAALHIASNARGAHGSFDVNLTALGLSATQDYDEDGMNDHAEYLLSALGFDWQTPQYALVQALSNGANSAGLYTTAQVQALNVGTPLIQKNASTGQFKLTISLQQSADLKTYTALPLSSGSATIDSAGALEFLFNGSSGAAFFRVQAQ